MVKYLLICIILTYPLITHCQTFEFTKVSRLPATVNTKAEEGMPLLSADGKRLFFTRAMFEGNHGGEYAGLDVWVSEYGLSGWKKADNSIGQINNKNHNAVVGLGQDNKTIYFLNVSPSQKLQGIYFTKELSNKWTRPELLSIPGINNLDFIGIYVSPDLDVIFLSMKAPDSRGNEDIYYSVKDDTGMWTVPRNIGATVNTTGFEISPFLSADKKRLYFASNGHPGQGDADIFYSERLYDSWETWSVPVNLGSSLNSKKFDAYFSIYGDSVAYFASNRESQFADLFRAKVIPVKTILKKGQRYLTAEEWGSIIGKSVSRKLSFENRSTTLNEPQQELIFYIVNKLMLEKDIRFHLVVNEEENPELTKSRLDAIFGKLKQSGIDPSRISEEQVAEIKKSGKGVIEIQLFR